MKIGKYEFDSREAAQTKIDALGTATDEDGNEYPTHKHSLVHLGHIVLRGKENMILKERKQKHQYYHLNGTSMLYGQMMKGILMDGLQSQLKLMEMECTLSLD